MAVQGEHDPYATPLYRRIGAVITWCVTSAHAGDHDYSMLFAGSIFTFLLCA